MNITVWSLVTTLAIAQAVSGLRFDSPREAQRLVWLLQNSALKAFAAHDPQQRRRFVAALYVPNQLLVVGAEPMTPDPIRKQIREHTYQDAYIALRRGRAVRPKFIVRDAGGDGLLTVFPGTPSVDLVYDARGRWLRFNGDAEGQGMTPGTYDARFAAADREYARMLKVLTSALVARRPR